MEYHFNTYNENVEDSVCVALKKINKEDAQPVFICVGSDLVLGDSLGPIVGTMLRKKKLKAYYYGTLNYPITAKEVDYASEYIKKIHPMSKTIAIDAAVGDGQDVGLIKVFDHGIKPGLGVNKDLRKIGDISIIGVVAQKSNKHYDLMNLTRLNLVYKMADIIANSIEKYVIAHNKKDCANLIKWNNAI